MANVIYRLGNLFHIPMGPRSIRAEAVLSKTKPISSYGSKGLLVSYAGYPATPSSLLPDNGLANLAGALIEKNHWVRILDYGTVDLVERLVPRWCSSVLGETYDHVMRRLAAGKQPALSDMGKLVVMDKILGLVQKREISRIASEVIREVERRDVDWVGFKLWNGDGFAGSVAIAKVLRKQRPDLKIFAGGPQVDCFPEEIFKVTETFDCLVYGEGEETLPLLADYSVGRGSHQLKDIPNLLYLEHGQVVKTGSKRIANLDDLPMPIYDEDVYPAMRGDRKIKILVIDDSRGCSNACNFCIHPVKSGKWRGRSADKIVAMISYLIEKVNSRAFYYAGSSTPAHHAANIAREIIKAGIRINYSSFGHVRGMSKDIPRLLSESGCKALFYGIETCDQKNLMEVINKGVTLEEVRNVLVWTKEAGIKVIGSLIYPLPQDDARTRQEILDFIDEVKPDVVPVQFPGLFPMTEWTRDPDKYGFEIPSWERFRKVTIRYKIRNLLPPPFWKPLPYKVGGKNFREYTALTTELIHKLEERGVVTSMGADWVLMAEYLRQDLVTCRERCRRMFTSGDNEAIRNMVKIINRNVSQPLPY